MMLVLGPPFSKATSPTQRKKNLSLTSLETIAKTKALQTGTNLFLPQRIRGQIIALSFLDVCKLLLHSLVIRMLMNSRVQR